MVDEDKREFSNACPLPPRDTTLRGIEFSPPPPNLSFRDSILPAIVIAVSIFGLAFALGAFRYYKGSLQDILVSLAVPIVGIILIIGIASISPTRYSEPYRKWHPLKPKRDSWIGSINPPETEKITDILIQLGRFKTFLAAVKTAGLEDRLDDSGPITVFAPTDLAFEKLPKGMIEGWLNDNRQLRRVLLYHVVLGEVMASDCLNMTSVRTLEGDEADIGSSTMDRVVRSAFHDPDDYIPNLCINDAYFTKVDIRAANGVVHAIDRVLIPPDLAPGMVKPSHWSREEM